MENSKYKCKFYILKSKNNCKNKCKHQFLRTNK